MPDTEEQQLMDEVRRLHADSAAWAEGLHLEFKLSESKVPQDLWETYSAFANTKGGVVLLGVQNDGTVKGVTNAEQQLKDLVTALNNENKVSINLCMESGNVCVMKLEGQDVIAIRVPEAELRHKPVYLNGRIDRCYYRINESDVQCKEEAIQQMLRDRSVDAPNAIILPHSSMADIDPDSLNRYRNLMRSYRPQQPWNQLPDKELLIKLGGYKVDRATGKGGLTLEGLLMFGSEDGIREFFPRLQLDFYEYDGSEQLDPMRRWADRICVDGTWTPNLFQFFFKVLYRITSRLKTPFRLNADMTARGESSAHVAVREALTNALIHADYRGVGGIVVRMYPEKLVLSNPGTLLIPRERIFEGGLTKCRNIALQNMFMMAGMAEKAGSGVDKIMNGWLEQCLVPPDVHEEKQPERVEWVLPFVGLLPKRWEEALSKHFGAEKMESLRPLERVVLMLIADGNIVTHRQIRSLMPFLHSSDLTRILTGLVGNGFLRNTGRTTAVTYSIASNVRGEEWKSLVSKETSEAGSSVSKEGESSVSIMPSSVSKEGESSVSIMPSSVSKEGESSVFIMPSSVSKEGESSVSIMPSSVSKEGESSVLKQGALILTSQDASADNDGHMVSSDTDSISWLDSIPYSLEEELISDIEIFRHKKRSTPDEMDRLVQAICSHRWVTLPMMAHILDRKQEYIRRKCVQPLLRHKLLLKRHEDDTHPQQAYTAAHGEE